MRAAAARSCPPHGGCPPAVPTTPRARSTGRGGDGQGVDIPGQRLDRRTGQRPIDVPGRRTGDVPAAAVDVRIISRGDLRARAPSGGSNEGRGAIAAGRHARAHHRHTASARRGTERASRGIWRALARDTLARGYGGGLRSGGPAPRAAGARRTGCAPIGPGGRPGLHSAARRGAATRPPVEGRRMAKGYVRLTQPLVRDGDRATGVLRPATWDEALDRAAGGFRRRRPPPRSHDLRLLLLLEGDQRGELRGPEVRPGGHRQQQHRQLQPHLTRSVSVAGLATVFGAGGGTSSYREVEETDLVVLWGSNARETHPIFFHHVLHGVHNGARLYAVDPRRTSSAAVGRRLARPRRRHRHRARQRHRPRDHRRRPAQRRVHRPRHDRLRGVPGPRRALHARVRRARDRRPGRAHPRARPRLRDGAAGDDLLDARHHRAPQRGRQRPRADQPGAAHRPRRPLRARA